MSGLTQVFYDKLSESVMLSKNELHHNPAIFVHKEFRALFCPEPILAAQKRLPKQNYDTTI